MRASWQERFAEASDVLKSDKHPHNCLLVLDLEIGGRDFITMAGPCSVETEQQILSTARHVRQQGAQILRGGAFKPRSSPYAFQGHGLAGLKMLAQARAETGLAIVTEVMSEDDVPLASVAVGGLTLGMSRACAGGRLPSRAEPFGEPCLVLDDEPDANALVGLKLRSTFGLAGKMMAIFISPFLKAARSWLALARLRRISK